MTLILRAGSDGSGRALVYTAVREAPAAVSRRGIHGLQYKHHTVMLVFAGVFDNLVPGLEGPAVLGNKSCPIIHVILPKRLSSKS